MLIERETKTKGKTYEKIKLIEGSNPEDEKRNVVSNESLTAREYISLIGKYFGKEKNTAYFCKEEKSK
jgi:hypothetical protein